MIASIARRWIDTAVQPGGVAPQHFGKLLLHDKIDQPAADGSNRTPLARLLAGEIAVGTVINILFNLFFAWLVFYGRTPTGLDGILLDVLPASFLPALLMTVPVTLLTRKRMLSGLRVTPDVRLPFALPRSLPLRSLGIAILALGLVAVPAVILLWLAGRGDWSWSDIVRLKIVFSASHAAIVTPIVVLAALGMDRRGG